VDRFLADPPYDRVARPRRRGGPGGDDRNHHLPKTPTGDGRADRFKDFVTGLNLCTGPGLRPWRPSTSSRRLTCCSTPTGDRDGRAGRRPPRCCSPASAMEDAPVRWPTTLTWGPERLALRGHRQHLGQRPIAGLEFQQAVWRFPTRSSKAVRAVLRGRAGQPVRPDVSTPTANLFLLLQRQRTWPYHAIQGGLLPEELRQARPPPQPGTPTASSSTCLLTGEVAGPRPGGTVVPRRCPAGPRFLGAVPLLRLPPAFRGRGGGSRGRGSTCSPRPSAAGLIDARRHLVSAPPDLCQGAPTARSTSATSTTDAPPTPTPERGLGPRQRPGVYRVAPPGHGGRSAASTLARPERPPSWSGCSATRMGGTPSRPRSQTPRPAAIPGEPVRPWPRWPGRTTTRAPRPARALGPVRRPGRARRRPWAAEPPAAPLGVRPGLGGPAPRRRRGGFPPRWLASLADPGRRPTRAWWSAASSPPRPRRLPGPDGLPIAERLLRRGLDRDDPLPPAHALVGG